VNSYAQVHDVDAASPVTVSVKVHWVRSDGNEFWYTHGPSDLTNDPLDDVEGEPVASKVSVTLPVSPPVHAMTTVLPAVAGPR